MSKVERVEIDTEYGKKILDWNRRIHCPYCTYATVWQTVDNSDYYLGETCICISCNSQFYEIAAADLGNTDVAEAIKAQL